MSNIKNETVGWKKLASKEEIQKTIESLKKNGFFAELAEDGEDAKKKVLDIIPEGSEVMNMTSVTLET
ncbi:MAG: LUD domain-containing protein, partial [Nanoarchaeota archaeon]